MTAFKEMGVLHETEPIHLDYAQREDIGRGSATEPVVITKDGYVWAFGGEQAHIYINRGELNADGTLKYNPICQQGSVDAMLGPFPVRKDDKLYMTGGNGDNGRAMFFIPCLG